MKNSDSFEKTKLSHHTPIPLYYQIVQIISEQIKSGELKPGDQILTEEKLQQKFDVSRATVRKAISELVYSGLLEKQYSKGTIVAAPKIEEAMFGVHSFTTSTLNANKSLTTKILEFKEIFNNDYVNSKLGIGNTEPLMYIKRVRYIDNAPVCVEDWYAPSKYLDNFNKDLFSEEGIKQSSYHILQINYNIFIKSVHDVMSAVAIDDEEDAALLNSCIGMPVLLRQRISYDEEKRPMVYSSGRYLIKIVLDFFSDDNNASC